MPPRELTVRDLKVGYSERLIIDGLKLSIPPGAITSIVGPNACGKSTLLRSMSRLLHPKAGQVLLDGKDIHRMQPKGLAKILGLLPQNPIAPEGITVADLVGRGRHRIKACLPAGAKTTMQRWPKPSKSRTPCN